MAKNDKYVKTGKANVKIRIPIPKPGIDHGDKTKYDRKPKHQKKWEDE